MFSAMTIVHHGSVPEVVGDLVDIVGTEVVLEKIDSSAVKQKDPQLRMLTNLIQLAILRDVKEDLLEMDLQTNSHGQTGIDLALKDQMMLVVMVIKLNMMVQVVGAIHGEVVMVTGDEADQIGHIFQNELIRNILDLMIAKQEVSNGQCVMGLMIMMVVISWRDQKKRASLHEGIPEAGVVGMAEDEVDMIDLQEEIILDMVIGGFQFVLMNDMSLYCLSCLVEFFLARFQLISRSLTLLQLFAFVMNHALREHSFSVTLRYFSR
jgi:hypothetical protein